MMEATYLIQPCDPILVRDGRPFSTDPGSQARTLEWPLPSTLAGAIRTRIGNINGFVWSDDGPDKARQISVHGPLMAVKHAESDWELYFSAPADAVVYKKEDGTICVARLSPMQMPDRAGCNLPEGLNPLMLKDDFKPADGYVYWPISDIEAWHSGVNIEPPKRAIGKLPKDTRVHVKIDSSTGANEQNGLFATESLCLPDIQVRADQTPVIAMRCRVNADVKAIDNGDGFLAFGGERRTATINETTDNDWCNCPTVLKSAAKGNFLKLQLVTPGIFNQGWKPGWMDGGEIPGSDGVQVKRIISAAVPRRIAISGWDYQLRGPKAARYACPAGTVFFMEVDTELTEDLFEKLWLCSICDDAQDNKDGFGLAIPGIWNYSEEDK